MCRTSEKALVKARPSILVIFSMVAFLAGFSRPLNAQTSTTTSSTAQESVEWERYTLKDRRLSVLLPTSPAVRSYSDKYWSPFQKSRLRNLIGAYSKGIGYSIAIYDLKQSSDQFIAESRLGSFRREVTASGIRGKEYAYEDEIGQHVTQCFLLGSRIYILGAHGSPLGNPDVDIPKFLESISFDESATGNPIVDGVGFQPTVPLTIGSDGTPVQVFTGKEVTQKARVFMKPEPSYTEAARQSGTIGTVVLRAIFTSTGAVTNISATSSLPHGLTENSIVAARQIRFIPAIKDGRFVSMYIQLEYNFNLY